MSIKFLGLGFLHCCSLFYFYTVPILVYLKKNNYVKVQMQIIVSLYCSKGILFAMFHIRPLKFKILPAPGSIVLLFLKYRSIT